ncbi:MAG: hypothetical protein QM769_10060 [Pseudoxanthomonas sp.]
MGALELLEIPTGRPYPQVLLAIFLISLLFPMVLGMLRDVLDRDRNAVAALLWPLRSQGFLLASVVWTVAGTCWVFMVDGNSPPQWIGGAALVMAWVMTPFLSWNPATLDDEMPMRWYWPWWPGWRALLICAGLWFVSVLLGFAGDGLEAIAGSTWLKGLLWVAEEAVSACVLIVAIITWLNRGSWWLVCADGMRLARSRFVREYLWQWGAIVVMGLAIAVPALRVAVEAIFVLPQYAAWDSATNESLLPWSMRLLSGLSDKGFVLLAVVSVPAGFYLNLACARLVWVNGVGRLASSGS